MKLTLPRPTLALLGAAVLLAGCAGHPARSPTEASQPQATPASQPASGTRSSESSAPRAKRPAPTSTPEQSGQLPQSTGIPACDAYLASYVACHRAAAIYRPDEIQGRYEAMRTSLLRDSQDPAIRPNLATRCNSLASQLRQALHGKSCEGGPATADSQAGD
ncbi:hypothetical protein [Frateuria sp. STR12]|uniref:hypothetical protein n=1 Tax=Frateuria hangzhouensis TaxID=2995589 RepID=UPI002260A253|nr:hypothetical protein [Frateuria sp. STR12]MCX7513534.1 hypothetical protein [Frateuria sp. STR12]